MAKNKSKIIDLTQTLNSKIPSWDGTAGFELEVKTDYSDCAGPDLFRIQAISTRAGAGTHIDAPAHCFPKGRTVDQLEAEELIRSCVVIDLSGQAGPGYLAPIEAVEDFEKKNGKIAKGSFVAFHTGWSKHWLQPELYRNDLAFPGISEEVAELLLKRDIAGLGTDTLSADSGGESFPVHRLILGADKYLIENMTNVASLPAIGSKIFILPTKIEKATEAPARIVAVIDK